MWNRRLACHFSSCNQPYAHNHDVIHRDLKPTNVLLDVNDEPKVTDFGLAKRVENDSHRTATGQVLGTPSYMPPEQCVGKFDGITHSADIYALGAVLDALLTARPPFQAATSTETLVNAGAGPDTGNAAITES